MIERERERGGGGGRGGQKTSCVDDLLKRSRQPIIVGDAGHKQVVALWLAGRFS